MVFADRIPWADWPELLAFFGMIVIAFSVSVQDPRGRSLFPNIVLSYLSIYVFELPTAVLVTFAGCTVGYTINRGWIPWRALFNGAQFALSVAVGAFIYRLLGGVPRQIEDSHSLVALIAAPLANHIANHFFIGYSISQRRGTPFLRTWLIGVRDLFLPNLLSVATGVFLAIMYMRVHYAAVFAYLALLPLQWWAIQLYIKRRQLYAQIVDGLVAASDLNFPLGGGHSRRVADLAVAIAREMRLDEMAVESVEFAALLHDVGMIGKDDLLERPVVTTEDAEGLQDHVRVGAEIARELPRKEIATMILRHHEKYDGSGYPEGLTGESIPLGARIIALAEAVDSMALGAFPHTSRVPIESIVSSITAEKGRAFDREVVEALLTAIERGSVAVGATVGGKEEIVRHPRLGESPAG